MESTGSPKPVRIVEHEFRKPAIPHRRNSTMRPALQRLSSNISNTLSSGSNRRKSSLPSRNSEEELIEPSILDFSFTSQLPPKWNLGPAPSDTYREPLRMHPHTGSKPVGKRSISAPLLNTFQHKEGLSPAWQNNQANTTLLAPVRRSISIATKGHSRNISEISDISRFEVMEADSVQVVRILGSAKPSPVESRSMSLNFDELDRRLHTPKTSTTIDQENSPWSVGWSSTTKDDHSILSEQASSCTSPATFYSTTEGSSRKSTPFSKDVSDYEAFMMRSNAKYDVEGQKAAQEGRPLTPLGYQVPVSTSTESLPRGRRQSIASNLSKWLRPLNSHEAEISTQGDASENGHRRTASRASSIGQSIREFIRPNSSYTEIPIKVHEDAPHRHERKGSMQLLGMRSKRTSVFKSLFKKIGDGITSPDDRSPPRKRSKREAPSSLGSMRRNDSVGSQLLDSRQ